MSRYWIRRYRACCAVLFLVLPAAGNAADASAQRDTLSLAQAITATVARNPELQSSVFGLRAADARITQAAIRPNPELSLQLENFGGSGHVRGTDAMETTFMLSQVVELGDKRDAREQAARDGYALLSVEGEARRLDILAEVTRRFIHVASDQEEIALAQRATALAETTLRAVEARVNAAKSPAVERHRAQILLTRAQVAEEHSEHELLSSRRKLAAMWGDHEADFGSVRADLFQLPEPGDFDALLARLKTNPDFTRFAHEQRLRDAELRLTETRRVPNIEIGAGIRQLQETDDHAFVVSVSMPLFTGSRHSGAVAEASARQAQVTVDEHGALLRAQAQLFELHQELRHALTEATVLRTKILPQTESILQQTEYAYQRGRYSYLDWIAAQRELLDARRSLIEASANAHRYVAEIERLTGESLTVGNASHFYRHENLQ
ncbi:MAG: TolC family protein [Spongiibacteraceae bacterium]